MIIGKAISIKQPWASLIVGYLHKRHTWIPPKYRKDIENRNWKYTPSYRGKLLIHASQSFDHEGFSQASEILKSIGPDFILPSHHNLYQSGCIIGEVYFNDVVTTSTSPWFFGRLGFKFRMPKPLKPISYKGNLGIWEAEIPDDEFEYITTPGP